MPRLFVALRPPPAIRARLLTASGGVPGARWQTDEQLHLTLRFVGEIDPRQADDLAAALGSIHAPAPSVRLAGTAASALAIECWSMGLKAQVADGAQSPDIFWVGRLGLAADPATAAPKPLYLRAPNATPQGGGGRVARL